MAEIILQSKFVKPKVNVNHGDIITFVDEGKLEKGGKYGDKYVFTVRLPNKEEKLLSMNNTSLKTMINEFGKDSAKWIDQEVKVHLVDKEVQGKFQKVIYLTHPAKDLEGNVVV